MSGAPEPTPEKVTRVIVVTGHRKLTPEGRKRVYVAALGLLYHPTLDTVIAGGALGVDTLLLDHLHMGLPEPAVRHTPLKTIVVVPGRLEQQPKSTWATSRAATELVQLGLTLEPPYTAYHDRNVAMFHRMTQVLAERGLPKEAGVCLAFSSGRPSGTQNAVAVAKKLGYRVVTVPV